MEEERKIDMREPDIKGMREQSYEMYLSDVQEAKERGMTLKELRQWRKDNPTPLDDSYLLEANEKSVW